MEEVDPFILHLIIYSHSLNKLEVTFTHLLFGSVREFVDAKSSIGIFRPELIQLVHVVAEDLPPILLFLIILSFNI